MFTSILVSTDFSPASWKAFEIGLSLSRTYRSQLHVLHIYPSGFKPTGQSLDDKISKLKMKMEKITGEMTLSDQLSIEHTVKPGNVESELLSFISEYNFDLIIMGINGNGQNNVPGKHTIKLMEKGRVPMLVVPNSYLEND